MFLRVAFNVDRMGDPAKIATADYFVESNLVEVKIGLGYAISIYLNNENIVFSIEDREELKSIRNNLLNTNNLNEVIDLLDKSREIIKNN